MKTTNEKARLIEAGQIEPRKIEAEDDRLYALYLQQGRLWPWA
jgi:hypothetical protein